MNKENWGVRSNRIEHKNNSYQSDDVTTINL